MIPSSRLRLIAPLLAASFTLLALAAPSARAELVMVDSLAARLHKADVVLIGTVFGITTLTTKAPRGQKPRQYREVAIATQRMLKGRALKVYRYVTAVDPRSTLATGQRVIAFLDRAIRYKDLTHLPRVRSRLVPSRNNAFFAESVMDLAKLPAPGVPRRDFAMVRDEDAIVAALQAASKAPGQKPGTVFVDAPMSSELFKAYYGGSAVMVGMPLDAVTEAQALKTLAGTDTWARAEAVKVLEHFQSPANVTRLKGLLEDTAEATRQDNAGTRTIVYLVREAAYEALTKWGVKVKKPPLTR